MALPLDEVLANLMSSPRKHDPEKYAATQTLGEEYTDIWQYSAALSRRPQTSRFTRAALILLPTLPGYLLSRWNTAESLGHRFPKLSLLLKRLPQALQVLTEINLAAFYIQGTYYDLVKRLLGLRHVCLTLPIATVRQSDRNFVYRSHQYQKALTPDRLLTPFWVYCWVFDYYTD